MKSQGSAGCPTRASVVALSLVLWGALPGCADPGITVTLAGWPPGAQQLVVHPSLDGRAGTDIVLPAEQGSFVVRVPAGAGALLHLDAVGLDGGGCKVAKGALDQALPAGIRPYADITLTLDAVSPVLCTLTLTVAGSGSASAVTTTGEPALLCGANATCSAEYPRGRQLMIAARETSAADYPTLSGGCVGLHDCTLSLDRARTVTAQIGPRICPQPHFCWSNPLPQGQALRGLWGSADNDLWVVGNSNVILHWDGRSFSPMPAPVAQAWSAVAGSSAKDIWIVGSQGAVLHYDGQSLSQVLSGTSNGLNGLWVNGPRDVWAAGDFGTLIHFDGTTWQSVAVDPALKLTVFRGVFSPGPDEAWAVGENGTAWHYKGGTGQLTTTAVTTMINSVYGLGASDIWAGTRGKLLHWQGSSWASLDLVAPTVEVTGLWSSASGELFVLGGTQVFRRSSGGFQPLPSNTSNRPLSLWGSDTGNIWAVGAGGAMAHFDGSAWTSFSEGVDMFVNGLWGSSTSDVWAVGTQGALARFDGFKWSRMPTGVTTDLLAITGTQASDIYAVGAAQTILHWDGTAVSKLPAVSGVSSNANLFAVWASGPKDVWASGGDPAANPLALHSTQPGVFATTTLPAGLGILYGLWGTGPTDVVTVDTKGNAAHYNGSAWSALPAVPVNLQFIYALWGSSASDYWAAGSGGLIWRYNGTSWSSVPSAAVDSITQIRGSSSKDIWLTAGIGVLQRWDGSSWQKISSGAFNTTSLWIDSTGAPWVGSKSASADYPGTILRYTP